MSPNSQLQHLEEQLLPEIEYFAGSALSLTETARFAVDEIRSSIECDRAGVVGIDTARQNGRIVFDWLGKPYVPAKLYGDNIDLDGTIIGEVAATGQTIMVGLENSDQYADRLPTYRRNLEAGMSSIVVVPITHDDRVIAGIIVSSDSRPKFTAGEVRQIEIIAERIAPVFQNVVLHQDMETEVQLRATLADIGRVITASSDLDTVFSHFADHAKKLIRFDRVGVTLIDVGANTVEMAFSTGVEIQGVAVGFRGKIDDLFLEYEGVRAGTITRDIDEIQEFSKKTEIGRRVLAAGLQSSLITPLRWNDVLIGALLFRSTQPERYSQKEIAIAEQIANQIAGAIENDRLRKIAMNETEREARFAEIGRIIGSSLDIAESYERIAVEAKNLLPFDRIVVSLIDEATKTTEAVYVSGTEVPNLSPDANYIVENSPTALAPKKNYRYRCSRKILRHMRRKFPRGSRLLKPDSYPGYSFR